VSAFSAALSTVPTHHNVGCVESGGVCSAAINYASQGVDRRGGNVAGFENIRVERGLALGTDEPIWPKLNET